MQAACLDLQRTLQRVRKAIQDGELMASAAGPAVLVLMLLATMSALTMVVAHEGTCARGACGDHVFTYFPSPRRVPAGRGEAVRIALHAAGIQHTDKFLVYSEYQELKAKTNDYVWKNGLPILAIDGKEFTQSLAALRYAGKKSGLYPKDDIAALAVDEILDITQDILTRAPQDPDETAKLQKRAEFAAAGGKMHSLVALLSQRAAETPASPWMVGSDMTIADLAVYFSVLKMVRDGDFDGVAPDYFDAWPVLSALEKSVFEHPLVKAWYDAKE